MSDMHDCLAEMDDLYNSLLLATVKHTEGLTACAMDLKPGVWLDLLPDPGDGFWAVCSESALVSADFNCSELPDVSKVEDFFISFADVRRSQHKKIWNDFDYTEFRGL